MELHKLFGVRVRELRRRAGLSQRELAEAVRLSATSISNMERGIYAPAFARLDDLAAALGVELHELFDFGGRAK